MVKYLTWLNPKNGELCIRYCRFLSNYDIGDIDGYGHILINILHLDYQDKKFYSMSFKDYEDFTSERLDKFLKRNRFKNLKRNFNLSMSDKLFKVAQRLRNK